MISLRSIALAAFGLLAVVAVRGCDADDAGTAVTTAAIAPRPLVEHRAPVALRPMRWLPGFLATAITERPSRAASERLDALHAPDDECRGAGTQAFAVTADVAPAAGPETVLASVAQGVVVVDLHERIVGAAPLADCGGSGDEMVALAAGDAWIGEPVIAVVATTGGHRESETDVILFTLGDQRRLERIFTGVLEERDGDQVREGKVFVVPGAIVVRSPDGAVRVLVFDVRTRRFTGIADG